MYCTALCTYKALVISQLNLVWQNITIVDLSGFGLLTSFINLTIRVGQTKTFRKSLRQSDTCHILELSYVRLAQVLL